MTAFFGSFFTLFLTWWGAFLLGALDSSMLFFLPFGLDTVVIYLSARNHDLFWIYPLLATAGSLTGAAVTFWIGRMGGEHGLERFIAPKRLERLRCRVRDSGAIALALPALMPPPFPLTPFILTCGALSMDLGRFLITFGAVRLLRFGGEAVLARIYGRGVLRILKSEMFQTVITAFLIVAVAGTIVSGILLWRSTRDKRGTGKAPEPKPAAP